MSPVDTVISQLDSRVDEFLKAGLYLRNWSPQTVFTYRKSLQTFAATKQPLTKAGLENWVLALRSRSLTPGGINVRVRSMNSFLSWLHEEGPVALKLRLKLLKAPRRVPTLLSPADIKTLLVYRPKSRIERRAARIVTHIYPHLLRHQFAASYIRQGGDIFRLSRLLGHSAVTTTQIYLRSLGADDLVSGETERLTPLAAR